MLRIRRMYGWNLFKRSAKFIVLLLLTSCTRYQWVAQEVKISTVGQRIHIEQVGKAKPIGDTTLKGMMIIKKRM